MKHILQELLLLGFDRERLLAAKNEIHRENRTCVIVYSSIVAIGMTILLLLSFFMPVLSSSRRSYEIAVFVGAIVLFLALGAGKKHTGIVVLCQYILIIFLLAFGIILGTVVEPGQASASFAVLIFVAPLLFADLPFRMNLTTVISIIIYIIAAKKTQSAAMFGFNLSVILPYGMANLVLTHFTAKMKIERHIYAHEKKILSEMDQLTGLRNRRRFERDVEKICTGGNAEIAICSFDVNYLKKVNDTFGHKAGDELLIAAGQAIEHIFGKYGQCYRIGGDEYMAIVSGIFPSAEELLKMLDKETAQYTGAYNFTLSISGGIAVGKSCDAEALILAADKQMYQEKQKYHALCTAKQE